MNHRRELCCRSVFRLQDHSGGDHHYMLVSDADHRSGCCVIVNWTTRRRLRGEDSSCILRTGDHPAITTESLVLYRRASLAPSAALRAKIVAGPFAISDVLLSEDAYTRVMRGFQLTAQVPLEVYGFLEEQGILPEMP